MLSPELQSTLQRAVDDVRGRRHEYLTLEHLLLAILDDPSGADIVTKCGGDPEKLRGELERFLEEQVEELPEGEESGPDQTLAFQRVLQRAAMHVQAAGRQQMTTGNVIASMFRERDADARRRGRGPGRSEGREPARVVLRRPHAARARGQDRSADRPLRRARAHDP